MVGRGMGVRGGVGGGSGDGGLWWLVWGVVGGERVWGWERWRWLRRGGLWGGFRCEGRRKEKIGRVMFDEGRTEDGSVEK